MERTYEGIRGKMTEQELKKIKGCLEALLRKCKTGGLYIPTQEALGVINRELRLKEIEKDPVGKYDKYCNTCGGLKGTCTGVFNCAEEKTEHSINAKGSSL